MGQISISHQQPPRLGSGIYYKDISFQNERQFDLALTDWIGGFVRRNRAMHLVMTAAGHREILDHIEHAPTSMALSGQSTSRPWRVHVEFFWGRTADSQWWVQGLGFHIKDTVNNIAAANKAYEIERLRDRYEVKHALAGIPAREAFFEIEKYSEDFDGDLLHGRRVVEILIEEAYGVAKEIAKMPTNPIGPNPDDPFSILMATIGAGAGETVNALSSLGYEARKVFEYAKTAVELGDKVRARISDNDPIAALADLIELGLQLSKFAGPWGPFVSIILGSFVEIAIANMAGPVSRVRSHMYACYVGGVVKELTNSTSIRPERPGDNVFFALGAKRARKISCERRYDLQLALMEYALRHPMGEWNLNPMFREKAPFPDAYKRYWSHGMLERALLVQLCMPKYLYK